MNKFHLKPWLQYRNNITDFLNLRPDRNMAQANFEVDISKMSAIIAERNVRVHSTLSHLAYLLWCYAQAVKQHPEMQWMKHKKQLFVFDDVDISMIFEKSTSDNHKVPAPYIFRAAQNKSYDELLKELVIANNMTLDELQMRKKSTIFKALPGFMRLFILRKALSHPLKWKEALGTVAFTTLGMTIRNRKFWAIPIGPYGCMLAAGSSFSYKDERGSRNGWCLTINFDHNLNDGGPAIRFGRTFIQLLESAEGLIVKESE
jgi:pyruvate/2-oxoglutarate dehydrogenase complex dihydrolipoamide acyltransferase (E2) component